MLSTSLTKEKSEKEDDVDTSYDADLPAYCDEGRDDEKTERARLLFDDMRRVGKEGKRDGSWMDERRILGIGMSETRNGCQVLVMVSFGILLVTTMP